MYGRDDRLDNCKQMILDFFKGKNSTGVLDLIIDIYQDIIYAEPNEKAAKEKLVRVLYSLQNSNILHTLLEEDSIEVFSSFLKDFLDIGQESNNYYIVNKEFAQLDIYELQNILIEVKILSAIHG